MANKIVKIGVFILGILNCIIGGLTCGLGGILSGEISQIAVIFIIIIGALICVSGGIIFFFWGGLKKAE
ncbi:MAG: hypothetical protein FK734_10080 [Asgard group archaeon]|nr:hypothetical protein [Asgard group archaeon]